MSMRENPPAVIDESASTVRRTIWIGADADKVWTAITEPEHISRWFGQTELDGPGVGARGTITWEGREPVALAIEAIEPPRSITYRWANSDGGETTFTFALEAAEDGTQLTVVETGFDATADPAAEMRSHRDGWDGELDRLVELMERGR